MEQRIKRIIIFRAWQRVWRCRASDLLGQTLDRMRINPDFGIVCRAEFEGEQDVLGMHVTWEKRYITLGPVATLLGLAFKLYDPNELLGGKKISALRWHSSPPAQLALILVVVIFHLMLPFRMVPILAKTYSSQ